MKKSLITLAVAATAVAPMAASAAMLQASGDQDGINLYGSFRPQVVSEADVIFADGGSRWGFKGTHDMGNGLSSFYRFERSFSTATRTENDTIQRLAYAGLAGGFGKVSFGNQWTPYYNTVGSPSDLFASTGLANYGSRGATAPFRSNESALIYALPKLGIVSGALGFIPNGQFGGIESDAVSAGLTIAAGPVNIGLGYNKVDVEDDSRLGLSVGGQFGPVGATFMVEDDGLGNPWAITGTIAGFALQYSEQDLEVDSSAFTAGYTFKMSSTTRLQLAYENADLRTDDKWVARYRVDF